MKKYTRLYFETSAINYMAEMIRDNPEFGSLATRKLQIKKGRKWQISNVGLWEIFLTKNKSRLNYLFDLSRCLFYPKLISSPEEIIINYIKNGCPKYENQYNIDSTGIFSKEWTTACNNLDFEFYPEREQLEMYTYHLRKLGELFVKTTKGYRFAKTNEFESKSGKIDIAFLNHCYQKILEIAGNPDDNEYKNFIGSSMQMVLFVLCYGFGSDFVTIEKYWNRNRKIEPFERLDILIKNSPEIFFRGPLANITKMMILQSNTRTSRGLYFDSLQSIYTTYSDFFLTNDDHFLRYKIEYDDDPNMNKVVSIKDMNFELKK